MIEATERPAPPRWYYRVQWREHRKVWIVSESLRTGNHYTEQHEISSSKNKLMRLWDARTRAREVMESGGKAALVCHGKDGAIQFEWTYPDDTPEREG